MAALYIPQRAEGCNRAGALCGVSKYLYSSDIKGENNAALRPTLQLLNVQNQGIEEGIRNSASFRFMATVNNFAKAEDLKKERKKFVAENLGPDSGGLALFPNTYTNVQQIKSQPEIVDPEQMQIIQTRVLNYFGCNEDVLQNKTVGDAWSAYYEGKNRAVCPPTVAGYDLHDIHAGRACAWELHHVERKPGCSI